MSGFEDLLGGTNDLGRLAYLLGGSTRPKIPHNWDHSQNPPVCRNTALGCNARWEANATPDMIKMFFTPTCPLTMVEKK